MPKRLPWAWFVWIFLATHACSDSGAEYLGDPPEWSVASSESTASEPSSAVPAAPAPPVPASPASGREPEADPVWPDSSGSPPPAAVSPEPIPRAEFEPEPEIRSAAEDRDPRSVYDGVYTSAQAARGQDLFQRECYACHTTGDWQSLFFSYSGRSVFDLIDSVRATMPLGNPGGLSLQDYVDVSAFILRLNGAPPGDVELPPEEPLQQEIQIEYRP